MTSLGAIFEPAPDRWGSRGDLHLWWAMRDRLRDRSLTTAGEATELLDAAFEAIVGVSLDADGLPDRIHRPDLDHGGMSGGYVSIDTWRSTLMPLLVSRAGSAGSGAVRRERPCT